MNHTSAPTSDVHLHPKTNTDHGAVKNIVDMAKEFLAENDGNAIVAVALLLQDRDSATRQADSEKQISFELERCMRVEKEFLARCVVAAYPAAEILVATENGLDLSRTLPERISSLRAAAQKSD